MNGRMKGGGSRRMAREEFQRGSRKASVAMHKAGLQCEMDMSDGRFPRMRLLPLLPIMIP